MVGRIRPGWHLVEADFTDRPPGPVVTLRIIRGSGVDKPHEKVLPVLLSGRIHELVQIPDDVVDIDLVLPGDSQGSRYAIKTRPVSYFERFWRMWNRVIYTYAVQSEDDLQSAGMTLRRAVFDLTGAYQAATEFRFRPPPLPYPDWVALFDTPAAEDAERIKEQGARLVSRARFHLVLNADTDDVAAVRTTLSSLRAQHYRHFACTILDGSESFSAAGADRADIKVSVVAPVNLSSWLNSFNTALADGGSRDWVLCLRAGDTLPAYSLYWLAYAISDHPDPAIVYADDDALDAAGERIAPRFKPDWSIAHMRSTNYLGNAVAVRGDVLAQVGGLDDDACRYGLFDKILQISDLKEENVIHLPVVLLHKGSDDRADAAAWEMRAVQRHLQRRGIAAEVSPTLPGCRRIRYQLPATPPLVSIIIPTRDGMELLRRCVDSVLGKTTYARFEILIVDNQSRDPAALDYLGKIASHPAVRVLPFNRPFNFSAINNYAKSEARGELLCLLNNDTEVITPDWLDEMVGHVLQDQVGVVGAKLLYPDGRVQHAGDTVGPGGCANHLHNGIARDDPGYCNRAAVAQDLSAVTAACLLTRRDLYRNLGGLDARWLRVAFNDVDYCLRVRAAGWRVVWTPHAELYHHESVSRGKNDTLLKKLRSEFEVTVMRRRWRHVMRNDPFYNPNLNYRQPDFTPGRTLRIKRPWQ